MSRKPKYTEREFRLHYARVLLAAAAEFRTRRYFHQERAWHATLLGWAAKARREAMATTTQGELKLAA